MKSISTFAVLAAMALSGCASVQRAASYSADGQFHTDARITVDNHAMSVSIHPQDNTLLAQRGIGDSAAGGFVQGLTFGIVKGWKPDPRLVDQALAEFVRPVGCRVDPVKEIGSDNTSFEAVYHCPAGTDLRALMVAQREALRRGEPLRPH